MKRLIFLILGCCILLQVRADISRTLSFNPELLKVTAVTINDSTISLPSSDNQSLPDEYQPLVVEGRTWWYGHNDYWGRDSKDFGLRIGKEVDIDGTKWREVRLIKTIEHDYIGNYFNPKDENTLQAYIREENKKVYSKLVLNFSEDKSEESNIVDDETSLIYDYSNVIGSTFDFGGINQIKVSFSIDNIDCILNSGVEYTRWTAVTQKEFCNDFQYLEKIGVVTPFKYGQRFFFPYAEPHTGGFSPSFLRYVTEGENNEVIYEAAGGLKLWDVTEGVENVSVDDISNLPVEYFDLQSRSIQKPASGSIVIRHQGSTSTKIIVP